MLVLGWHGGVHAREEDDAVVGFSTHDGAAVLLKDGEIVAAVEEERLSRVKHANFFPARAIRSVLAQGGVELADLDYIVSDVLESVLDGHVLFESLAEPRLPVLLGRDWIAALFEREFGQDIREKVRFCKHHLAHLYGAFYPSGYERALVVALDGEGDGLSGMAAIFDGQGVAVLREHPAAESLGDFYTKIISLLGYRRFDEYKVMGLAPYGDPRELGGLLERMVHLGPGGKVEIEPDPVKIAIAHEAGLTLRARRKGQPFEEIHHHLAAALQRTLERMAFHVLGHLAAETGERTLCLSGGVAHNCTMNGKLLASGLFDRVFVQPAAHDAGNALGAALWLSQAEGTRLPHRRIESLFLGADLGGGAAIEGALDAWRAFLSFERDPQIAARAASRLSLGAVIGWVQGRAEFGPRALGNRSILADPRPAENKQIINRMVKKREAYRPFAPSVHEERLGDFFEVPTAEADLSFMNFVLPVRREHREALGAITHVDGTARVQTVSRQRNPSYHALIAAFEELTGVPILLNTSFNNDAEPIVDSVEDAIVSFLTTGIDDLFIGDYHVRKRALGTADPAIRALVPALRRSRKLVKRTLSRRGAEVPRFAVESTVSDYFGNPSIEVSEQVFHVLLGSAPGRTIDELLEAQGVHEQPAIDAATAELFELWERRAVVLHPRGGGGA